MAGAGAAFARRWKAQSQNHCGVAARPHWECAVVLEIMQDQCPCNLVPARCTRCVPASPACIWAT